jgi:phosphoribosylformylglycinamidine synthase
LTSVADTASPPPAPDRGQPQALHRALGLTDWEFARIGALLDREPNDFELAVFSLLWSEHCGYKHSALLLRRFPTDGPAVLQGPGENAGVVDLGDGLAVAFKVESHNHPSAVEPFQGAATGVGGILRDIAAMGARPVALLDSLRFGDLEDEHQGWMFGRAVAGIGHYGNCVGVPTVGGEAVFDDCYGDNCLVNAMCVGLLPADRVTRARMTGPGNLVVLYGATTGRDGIGGASVLASQELSENGDDKRPSVQIGDPFTGKKLIEASLELVEGGLVESLQDCGAAGLASSLSEMASKGGAGVDVHLDRVPLREPGMEPWEIVISESQERMVAVCSPERLDAVLAVCGKWELAVAVVGEVTGTGRLRAFFDGEPVGDIPARLLTEECPRYRVETRPRPLAEPVASPDRPPASDDLLTLLASPALGSREWVYRRYDQLVGSRTVRRPGLDAAVLRLRPSYRGLAVSLDGAGRMASLDPHAGGALAVLEAARNVACAGGRPLAFTDCLNFGNPEKPEIAWELAEAIEGMALACEALGLPVVSGNVSLYNETDGRAIHPTPVVGCLGLVEDVRSLPGAWRPGDVVLLAGAPELRLDGSEYQALLLGGPAGRPPLPDLAVESGLIGFLHRAAPLASCLHDAAEGGLAVALAECAIVSGAGAELRCVPSNDPVAVYGEGGGQAILACDASTLGDLERLAEESGVPLSRLGTAGGDELLGVPVDELRAAYERALPERLGA